MRTFVFAIIALLVAVSLTPVILSGPAPAITPEGVLGTPTPDPTANPPLPAPQATVPVLSTDEPSSTDGDAWLNWTDAAWDTQPTALPNGLQALNSVWDGSAVHIFGGYNDTWFSTYDMIQTYWPSNGTLMNRTATLLEPLSDTAVVWNGTHALIFGGFNGSDGNKNISTYDPVTDSLVQMGATLPHNLWWSSAVWNGTHALLLGGWDGWNARSEILAYDPVLDMVTNLSVSLPEALNSGSAVIDGDDIYYLGGFNISGQTNAIVHYDQSAASAILHASTLPVGVSDTSATFDGTHAYLFGGNDIDFGFPINPVRFTPGTGAAINMSSPMPAGRAYTTAVWTGTTNLLIGGVDDIGLDIDEILSFAGTPWNHLQQDDVSNAFGAATTAYSGTGGSFEVTGLAAGDHYFRVSTDNVSWSNTITINVEAPGDTTDPTADAGPDQAEDDGTLITFNGGGSMDDVLVTNWTWVFDDGGPMVLFDVGPTYTFSGPGVYWVNLTVSDAAGNMANDSVNITINAVSDSTPPTADAGVDSSVVNGTAQMLNGSGSMDDTGIVNWTWTYTDGGAQQGWGEFTNVTFTAPGDYNVTLNVTDLAGNWALDWVIVNVTILVDSVPPIADAGVDIVADEDILVVFDGTGSSDDIGILGYVWNFVDGDAVALINATPNHTFATPGDYLVTLIVYDAALNSATDTVNVTIRDITAPMADAGTVLVGDEDVNFSFSGTASSDNVDVVSYLWEFDDDGAVSLTGDSAKHNFSKPGFYEVNLTVADAAGNTNFTVFTITILDTTDPVPVSVESHRISRNGTIMFNGTNSTDNVGIVNYTWDFGNGNHSYVPIANQTYTVAGWYEAFLNLTDAAGNIGSLPINVTVLPPPPVADAGPDRIINPGYWDDEYYIEHGPSRSEVGIAEYRWTITRPNGFVWNRTYDYDSNNVYFYSSASGIYNILLTVTDVMGQQASDQANYTLDYLPLPAFYGPSDVVRGHLTYWNGSYSADHEGEIVNWTWTFPGEARYGPLVNYTFTGAGTSFTINLKVIDEAGFTRSNDFYVGVTDFEFLRQDSKDVCSNERVYLFGSGGQCLLMGEDYYWDDDHYYDFWWYDDEQRLFGYDYYHYYDYDYWGYSPNVPYPTITYTWTFEDTDLMTLDGFHAFHTFSRPGFHPVTLTVSDGLNSYTDQITFTVLETGDKTSAFYYPDPVIQGLSQQYDGTNPMYADYLYGHSWVINGEAFTGAIVNYTHLTQEPFWVYHTVQLAYSGSHQSAIYIENISAEGTKSTGGRLCSSPSVIFVGSFMLLASVTMVYRRRED